MGRIFLLANGEGLFHRNLLAMVDVDTWLRGIAANCTALQVVVQIAGGVLVCLTGIGDTSGLIRHFFPDKVGDVTHEDLSTARLV